MTPVDKTLFDGQDETPMDANDDLSILTAAIDPEKDYLGELVGDDKRYKTPQALASSKVEGDNHIKRLERELRGLRDELSSKSSVEALLTEMKTLNQNSVSTDDGSTSGDNQASSEAQLQSNITPEQIDRIVAQRLLKERSDYRENENFNLVKETLSSLGEAGSAALSKVQTDYGMSKEQVNGLARSNPKALLALLPQATGGSVEEGSSASLFTQGNLDSQRVAPSSGVTGRRDWAYYEKMRKSNPDSYWSRDTQTQLHNDAIALGEDFSR